MHDPSVVPLSVRLNPALSWTVSPTDSNLGRVLDWAGSGKWHSHVVAEECLALSRMGAAATMHVLAGMRVVSWVLNPSGWFPGRSSSRACDLEGVPGGCLANHHRLPFFLAGHSRGHQGR
jgi:hypothetical protein